jgi:hypothetical protein
MTASNDAGKESAATVLNPAIADFDCFTVPVYEIAENGFDLVGNYFIHDVAVSFMTDKMPGTRFPTLPPNRQWTSISEFTEDETKTSDTSTMNKTAARPGHRIPLPSSEPESQIDQRSWRTVPKSPMLFSLLVDAKSDNRREYVRRSTTDETLPPTSVMLSETWEKSASSLSPFRETR